MPDHRPSRRPIHAARVWLASWLLACALAAPTPAAERASHWIGSWTAAPTRQYPPTGAELPVVREQTLRTSLRLSAGGNVLRVRFTNEFGSLPLVIGAASVAIDEGSGHYDFHPLRFAGEVGASIAAGAPLLSDALALRVAAGARLIVSLYLPEATPRATAHTARAAVTQLSATGDFTAAAELPGAESLNQIPFVSAVDVVGDRRAASIVVIGQSRTEGEGRWLEPLAQRLAARGGAARAVVNASVQAGEFSRAYPVGSATPYGGQGALAGFDRDVLGVAGVRFVIIADAVNDIAHPGWGAGEHKNVSLEQAPGTAQLIAAYRQIVARAHDHGVKVFAATLVPFKGEVLPGFWSGAKEAQRQQLNAWIRSGGVFDGVLDFDAVVRDPADPARLKPGFAGDNGYQMTPAAEQALADSIPASLFR